MSEQIPSLTPNKGRALILFASLLTGMVLLFGLDMRTAETQTTPPTYYEVQDLGTLQGGSTSVPLDINDSGHVVGCADTESGQQHAFLYKDGEMKDLGTLSGGNNSCAYGINNSGQIVGYSETATSGEEHAFIWKDDGDDATSDMDDLGTLPGGKYSYAYDINNHGQVVGYSERRDSRTADSPEVHPFIWKDDGDESTTDMKDPSVPESPWLGTWPWGENSYAYGINDSGQVVGQTNDHAFLYDIGTKKIKDLGDLGGYYSEAHGINASGQVVGRSDYSGSIFHAFLYSGEGPMQDLGDLVTIGEWGHSWAWDINDSGQVVGNSDNDYYSPTAYGSAFLYQNGEMIDLNTRLIPDNTGSFWNLYWALGINNNGQIVVDSTEHALLLTPSDTPPPSDTTPPNTTITSQPEKSTNSTTASFSFTSDETGATFECSNDNQSWASCTSPYNYSSTALQDGSYNFYVRANDAAGNVDPTPASYSWTVDKTAPVAQAPTQTLTSGSSLGTSAVPVTLSWSATDNTSGVTRYELQQSVDGGASWSGITLSFATQSTITRQLTPGQTYKFQIRAQDGTGNWSAWEPGPTFKVNLFEEANSAISYTGTWSTQKLTSFSGGSVKYASTPGTTTPVRSAKLTQNKIQNIGWVSTMGPDRGKAEVSVDGAKSTPDLYASNSQYRKVVYVKNALDPSVSHSLETRPLGTKNASSSGTRVDVDALVVLSSP